MRILWLNWRDIKHPEAGGAEVFTHEVLCRLEKKGYETTLFTERFPGSSPVEYVDNVRIIRDGGKFNVYSKAKDYYKKYKKNVLEFRRKLLWKAVTSKHIVLYNSLINNPASILHQKISD